MMEINRNLVKMARNILRDRMEIIRLRYRIFYLKIFTYDQIVSSNRALRAALATMDQEIDDVRTQLANRDTTIEDLKTEFAQLSEQKSRAEAVGREIERLTWFKRLQEPATQLPSVRAALDGGAPLTASDVMGLMRPLLEVLEDLGFEQIGRAGSQASYDPTRHHAVGRGAKTLNPDDNVRVRYIGYLFQGKVLAKAEVTRADSEEIVRAVN